MCREWIEQRVVITGDYSLGYLMTMTEVRSSQPRRYETDVRQRAIAASGCGP